MFRPPFWPDLLRRLGDIMPSPAVSVALTYSDSVGFAIGPKNEGLAPVSVGGTPLSVGAEAIGRRASGSDSPRVS